MTSYSRDALVHRLFAEQAHRTPDAAALFLPASRGGGTADVVSYRELDGKSNGLARRLPMAGVRPGHRVAVLMDRSPEMILAMLAILKAGAVYVPLDPSYPQERLDFMLADSGACVLMMRRGAVRRDLSAKAVELEVDIGSCSAVADPRDGAAGLRAEDPAYVIYTSGSTGRPKGVLVPHRGIVRLLFGTDYARLDSTRLILQLAPVSFDAATFEIWGALLHGGCCVLYPGCGLPDLALLAKVIRETGVTTLWLTASLFNMIIDQSPGSLAGVEEVLTGGEALSVPHVRKALALLPDVQLINGYGPTESTTFACCYRIPKVLGPDLNSIPIGPPIANTTIRILDADLRPVAAGEAGDLYIGGDGLAIGYLDRPELTAERFIAGNEGERLYRSGDRARQLPGGAYEFLGRLDDQVKLRGHRVELAEIESALRAHDDIGDAVVLLREDSPGDKRLVAYYSGNAARVEPSVSVVRRFLLERLPEYMVPSHFVPLRSLPLTPNGKADRNALPAPGRQRPALEAPLVRPRTPVESWLAAHWCELLNLEEVGVQDRFFELGGTSIAAMRLLGRLSRDTQTTLSPLLLFRAPTVADLATILEHEHADVLPVTPTRRVAAPGPMSANGPVVDPQGRQRDLLRERRMRRRHGS